MSRLACTRLYLLGSGIFRIPPGNALERGSPIKGVASRVQDCHLLGSGIFKLPPRRATERPGAPGTATEHQGAPQSARERPRASGSATERQKAPQSARERHRAPGSASDRQCGQGVPRSATDFQRAPQSATERHRAPQNMSCVRTGRWLIAPSHYNILWHDLHSSFLSTVPSEHLFYFRLQYCPNIKKTVNSPTTNTKNIDKTKQTQ